MIAVTRFPYDAFRRYLEEPDFNEFKDRLHICEFDLKRVDRLNMLITYVMECFEDGLDILINNAAQTIRKAPSYYQQLSAAEKQLKLKYSGELPVAYMALEAFNTYELLTFEETSDLSLYETPEHNSWVSNQFPAAYEVSKQFEPYLTFDDGAARICAPIYAHLNDKQMPKDVGALYKDYKIMPY